jgi:hypothetical protein
VVEEAEEERASVTPNLELLRRNGHVVEPTLGSTNTSLLGQGLEADRLRARRRQQVPGGLLGLLYREEGADQRLVRHVRGWVITTCGPTFGWLSAYLHPHELFGDGTTTWVGHGGCLERLKVELHHELGHEGG